MQISKKDYVVWAPRILGLLFAGFLGLFALDVFDEPEGLGRTLAELAIHLFPTGLVLTAVAIGWRWPLAGTVLFAAMGAWYASHVYAQHPQWILPIAGPTLVIALLFAASWRLSRPGA